MKRDLRGDPRYRAILEDFARAYGPGVGRLHGAADAAVSPDGRRVAFDGPVYEKLEGVPVSRIAVLDLAERRVQATTSGPNSDKMPRWSPDGETLAFLSDRATPGRFALYRSRSGAPAEAQLWCAPEDATIESFAWSADGARVLVCTAGIDADATGESGSGTLHPRAGELPAWMPEVEENVPERMWRRAWVLDAATGALHRASAERQNVWEAAWAGSSILCVASADPREGSWYDAELWLIEGAHARVLYAPDAEIGLPAASPDGEHLAAVEACCSDRNVVAGDVLLFSARGGEPRRVDAHGVDVTALAWAGRGRFLYTGVRSFETVAGYVDASTGLAREVWCTRETTGGRYPAAAPVPGRDAFAVVLHSFSRYPALAVVEDGRANVAYDFADEGSAYVAASSGTLCEVTWNGRDGLEIGGYLALPPFPGPHPLVVNVHGGPVWSFRNAWSLSYYFTWLLVKNGYAVLAPNPRGSSGRGQEFARMVRGDMCGEDTHDIIEGVRALVDRGVADPQRLAVLGKSYGGYMSSWLVTQTDLFAAAIPISPVTDNLSFAFTSNIARFNEIFLDDTPYEVSGRYAERSPVFFARNVRTPTLHMAGALDRCTPASQALEFHRALVENGVESELVIYPQEGHGVRALEAQADQAARMLAWLETHVLQPGTTALDRTPG